MLQLLLAAPSSGQSALGIQQKGAHSRNCRHSGSRHADLLGTDG